MCGKNPDHENTKSKCFNNMGLAAMRLEEHKDGAEYFSSAIELIDNYVKARFNRAKCYSKIEEFEKSSADMKFLEELAKELNDGNLLIQVQQTNVVLEKEYKEATTKKLEEVKKNLKPLADKALGFFGLSLDNFKMQ
jgi:tetratricopeptide (TPR) repeat protein